MYTVLFYAWISIFFFFIHGISCPIKKLSFSDVCLILYRIARAFLAVFLILFCLIRPDKSCGHPWTEGVRQKKERKTRCILCSLITKNCILYMFYFFTFPIYTAREYIVRKLIQGPRVRSLFHQVIYLFFILCLWPPATMPHMAFFQMPRRQWLSTDQSLFK